MAGGGQDDTYTYDLATPRVPTSFDFGGEEMADEDEEAPQYGTEMTAGGDNERNRNLEGLNRVGSLCRIWVEFTGIAGAPVVTKVLAMGTSAKVDESKITPDGTNGPGVTRLSWAPGTLPPMEAHPVVSMNDGPCGTPWARLVNGNPNAVDVFTTDISGAAADFAFTVALR